jgi:hypothetical protein
LQQKLQSLDSAHYSMKRYGTKSNPEGVVDQTISSRSTQLCRVQVTVDQVGKLQSSLKMIAKLTHWMYSALAVSSFASQGDNILMERPFSKMQILQTRLQGSFTLKICQRLFI